MKANNVLGIIFSNMHDDKIRELTDFRTMGSVPFGGRYRLIDFALSNMVHSEIKTVGVVTKRNYQSLMDHLGSGKAWDLSRKRDGLFLLPPFGSGNDIYKTRVEALDGIMSFLHGAKQDYVVLTDSNIVSSVDFQDIIEHHIKKNAHITVAYKKMEIPQNMTDALVLSNISKSGRIKEVLVDPQDAEEVKLGVNIYVIKREFLIERIQSCMSKNQRSFIRDIIQNDVENHDIYAYEIKSYLSMIISMDSYFKTNMSLLDQKVRDELFNGKAVYTKILDDMPAIYGLGSKVKNSIIADGCVIEGTVENCIVFRGVKIHKDSVVRDSIIMQGSEIGENCELQHVVLDKKVKIGANRRLTGFGSYPNYIAKNSIV